MDEIKINNNKLKQNLKEPNSSNSHTLTWSPLPVRSPKFNFKPQRQSKSLDLETERSLYPKCDASVWLRSCEQEILDPIPGKVSGTIPLWLNGSLIRNGPGSLKVGNDYFDHLFDASALLHRFGIQNGKVTYQCRFLQSEVFKRNSRANRIVLTEFGTTVSVPDPCHSIFDRAAAMFCTNSECNTDNSMISVYPYGDDQVYACGESPIIHRIDPKTLETGERVNVSNYVSIVHHSAHPHITPDGNYNLALSMYRTGPHHTVVKISEGNFDKAEIVADIPVRWKMHPPYMHSFGITENFFVIVEQPLCVSLGSLLVTKIKNEALIGSLRWYQDEKTIISLVDRKTGKLAYTFHSEPFFFLHVINSYDLPGYVVLDICIYRDPSVIDCMYIEAMKTMQQNENYARMFRSKPVRFVLPINPEFPENSTTTSNLITLKGSKAEAYFCEETQEILVTPEKLADLGCETPRINNELLGKPYRYFYAISSDVDGENPGTVIKIDTQTKEALTWCEKNCYPSEPIFVPSPNSQSEDDGVVLAALVWGGEDVNHAGLIVLDAKSLKEIGRSEFLTPGPVPKCLHGWFVHEKEN